MPDERTYGFNVDDATALLQSIGTQQTPYIEITNRKDFVRRQVVMKADLLAAVNFRSDPSEAEAYVLQFNNDRVLVATGQLITIVNRFENISVEAGTYCKAEWIDGEWQLYAADCPGTLSASSFAPSVSISPSVGSI